MRVGRYLSTFLAVCLIGFFTLGVVASSSQEPQAKDDAKSTAKVEPQRDGAPVREFGTALPQSRNASECVDDSFAPAHDASRFPLVEHSRPGPWRRNLKLQDPEPLDPGRNAGRSLSAEGPRPAGIDPSKRWLPGYRPQTPEARAEYEAWMTNQRMLQATAAKAPADNLWRSATGAGPIEAEPDTHRVTYYQSHEEVRPVKIDLANLPAVEAQPKAANPHDIHHHSGLTYDEYIQLKEMVRFGPDTPDAQTSSEGTTRAPSILESFDGEFNRFGSVPPDPILAVSSNHLIEIVNNQFSIWNIAVSPPVRVVTGVSLASFFSGVPNCGGTFDVYVDFNEEDERWVMGGMSFPAAGTTYLCLAATDSADPVGGNWSGYSYSTDANAPSDTIDFPHMAIGQEAVYIAGNMFDDNTGNFTHVRLYAFDKNEMYAGAALTNVAETNIGGGFFTAMPAKLHGFKTGEWPLNNNFHFIANQFSSNNTIWRWSDPFNQSAANIGTFSATWNGAPPNAPESGDTLLNDTNSGAWGDAEERGGSLWATRSVACNLGGGPNEACVDWVQVDVTGGSPALQQQQQSGAYGATDQFLYYPDGAVDRAGNFAVGYTKSSSSTFTEVWVTGREFGDAAGTLQADTQVVAGTGFYTDGVGCGGTCDRWGDYSGMTVDPDGCNFWTIQEYSDGPGAAWKTRIAAFKYATCSVDSAVNVDSATYTCGDTMSVTVTDAIRLDSASVAAAVTITTSNGDSEATMAGDWLGSDCVGADCGTWEGTFPVSSAAGGNDDGVVNVADGGTITIDYADPHGSHTPQSRTIDVVCDTAVADGGFIISGGCEDGTGTELYTAYFDGNEYLAYEFGIFNPATAPALTDVEMTLNVTGPAATAGLITVLNPTVHIGALDQDQLTSAVFNIYVDPAVDSATYRLSDLNFEVSVTSVADGYTVPQVISQSQFAQGDDNIVQQQECFNFESGNQGWLNERYEFSYAVGPITVNTVTAPWTVGNGCGSETRTDYPEMSCDIGGSQAFKTNPTAGSCGNFPQTSSQLFDDINYSPIFGPVNTGNAPNGQPWKFTWLFAEWFYFSRMTVPGSDPVVPTTAYGHFWDSNYMGVADPAPNEIDIFYDFALAYFFYGTDTDWDSATGWDPLNPPANYAQVGFPVTATGDASLSTQWRWALEVYDNDFGDNPTTTAASEGLAVDNMNLVYDQFHAQDQFGTCADSVATASFDRTTNAECPAGDLSVSILDDSAASVTVTLTSTGTGDSETITIAGPGPLFQADVPYSTAGGSLVDDGTLYVNPSDTVALTYDDGGAEAIFTAESTINCNGGDVQVAGVSAFVDNGDSDTFADTNETASISFNIVNNTASDLQNAVAWITTDDPDVECIIKDMASFGTITGNGGISSNDVGSDPFEFKIANTAECSDPNAPPSATFDVFILADGFDGPNTPQKLTFTLDLNDLPGTITVTESFDVQPAGWTHFVGPGDDDGIVDGAGGLVCGPYVDDFFWLGTGGNPNGGFFAWQDPGDVFPNGTYSDLNDAVLLSPVFKIGASSTNLSFDHEYKFADASGLAADGVRVDFSINGGAWQKMQSLPYDNPLIFNSYCSPLCNNSVAAGAGGVPCFSENPSDGENIFNVLGDVTVNWTNVAGSLTGLTTGDQVQFRWRFGSMNSQGAFPTLLFTDGGYGLDNVAITNVTSQECDTAINPDIGCGVTFDSAGNLTEVCGDGDLLVEPTEDWTVDVTLKNSQTTSAVNTTADLGVNVGSTVLATVSGNPGSYGTIAPAGGTGTASYGFSVDAGAVCVNDITFDVLNITDDVTSHGDDLGAFAVPVGGVGGENATQDTPIAASSGTSTSTMSPAFTLASPVDIATLSYDFNFDGGTLDETATIDTDPFSVTDQNSGLPVTMSPSFTVLIGDAATATVDWTSLTHQGGNLTSCVQVELRTPDQTDFVLKAFSAAPANPYDVLSIYTGVNGGPGQYEIVLAERAGGSCPGGSADLTGGFMNVTTGGVAGDWTNDVQVSLFDGTSSAILKGFGVPDANPYDVTSIYNAAGPGTYEIQVEESAGGTANLTNGSMDVSLIECDLGCSCAPPGNADEVRGNRNVNDVVLTFEGSGTPGATYNIYRDTQPNPALFPAPIATGVTDEDGGTPGIQWTDVGATLATSEDYYYKITEVNCGGEEPL